jgi:PAS domain S-box-containing protein
MHKGERIHLKDRQKNRTEGREKTQVPESRTSRLFEVGAMTILLVVLATLSFVWYQFAHYEQNVRLKAGLYADLLNERISTTLSRAESDLVSLAARLSQTDNQAEEQIKNLFENARFQPDDILRSITLFTEDGRVLSSTGDSTKASSIAWPHLGSHEGFIGAVRWAPILFEKSSGSLSSDPASARSAVLPMVKQIQMTDSKTYFLVTLVNLEFVTRQFEPINVAERFNIAMASDQGVLWAANAKAKLAPGSNVGSKMAWWKAATKVDQGEISGRGLGSSDVVGIYRASRVWPIVFIVERSTSDLYANLPGSLIGVLVSALTLCAMSIAGLLFLFDGLRRTKRHHLESQRAFTLVASSEKRKYAILQAAQEAVITVNSLGFIVEYNPAAEQMFGSKIVGNKTTPISRLVLHADIRASRKNELIRHFERVRRGESPGRLEIMASRDDGFAFPVEFTISRLIDQDKLFYTLVARDISERHRAQVALKISEKRLKHALSAAGDGVWDLDVPSGRMTYSSNGLGMLGYRDIDVEASQRAWLALVHQADLDFVNTALITHLVGKSPSLSVEYRMLCADGSWKWILTRGAVVQRSVRSGHPLRLVGTHSDITERKSAENQYAALLGKSWEMSAQLRKAHEIELQVGSKIQNSLLVNSNQKRLSGLWLSTFNQVSQGVDGDFFDILCPGVNTIDIVSGDVMGKGVNAALMGAAVKMQLSRSMLELVTDTLNSNELPEPTEVLASLHLEITPHLQALDAFVTLSYLRINTLDDTVTWVGCGHEEPTLCRPDGTMTVLQNEHAPLGVMNEVEFEQRSMSMLPGDALFIHSDGVSDALLADGNRVGLVGLRDGLASLIGNHKSPGAILHQLRKKLFATGTRFTDDLTMILATRVPRNSTCHREELGMDLREIARVRSFVSAELMESGLSAKQIAIFVLASVEVFTNIVRHTTGALEGAPVELIAYRLSEFLQLEFIYIGNAFTPVGRPKNLDHEDLPEGGFGLRIIEAACDHVEYLHDFGVNTIRIRKTIRAQEIAREVPIDNLVTLSTLH